MIELRRLRYMVVLANRLSYSKAAADIGISQSALTRAILSLEQEVGMRLFDRDQSGVRLTEQGRWMAEKAEALLVNASEFNRQVNEAAGGNEGRLRFGMSPLAANCLLAETLGDRIAQRPSFAHEVLVGETERLWLMLAQGEIEFLVSEEWASSWPVPEGLPVAVEPLGAVEIGLAVRPGHPLGDGADATTGFPVIANRPRGELRQLASDVARHFGGVVQVIEEFGAAADVVRSGDAIWLCAVPALARWLQSGAMHRLDMPAGLGPAGLGPWRAGLSLYRLERRTLSPAAAEVCAAFFRTGGGGGGGGQAD